MPASVVFVHDDAEFREQAALALRAAGHKVMTFVGSMAALNALENAETVELLITRVNFPPGTPNGISLALMTRTKRPDVKVLFTATPESEEFIGDLGTIMRTPVAIPELVATATAMLNEARSGRSPA
jgi:DNA-binding response OmpR family regulator